MKTLNFLVGYISLQLGIIVFLTNPLNSMSLTIICFLLVAVCYCLVSPFIKCRLKELKHFDKFVFEIYQSNRRHPLSEKFGTEISKHLSKNAQSSSDKKKDIGAYVATDLYLSLFTFGIAVAPGLLIHIFLP
jgi:ABC-type transport system involved in multi-copper enzyme maturation permease subunit